MENRTGVTGSTAGTAAAEARSARTGVTGFAAGPAAEELAPSRPRPVGTTRSGEGVSRTVGIARFFGVLFVVVSNPYTPRYTLESPSSSPLQSP